MQEKRLSNRLFLFCFFVLLNLSFKIFFVIMLLHPPRLTLFPYTTLFRSRHRQHRHHPVQGGRARGQQRHLPGRGRDRKSTRLNSSHVAISYAVSCSKKRSIASSSTS